MAAVLIPFICLAAVGLALSLVAHVWALFGLPQPLGNAAWWLHLGIFVVWLPAVIASNHLVKDFKQKESWRAALRGCPKWMWWISSGFAVYAVANFFTFIAVAPRGGPVPDVAAPPVIFRGFSGHWMAFYSGAIAILYSALVTSRHDPARRCPNAHPVSPSAAYCETCGARIQETDYDRESEGTTWPNRGEKAP
jgi:hypothetical protein